MKNIKVLSGNIGIEESFSASLVFSDLAEKLYSEEAYLSYKFPALGKDNSLVPSITIISARYGIIIIDVVDDEIVSVDDDYWITATNREIPSRDQLIENHTDDIIGRLKRNPLLYNKKEKNLTIPIHKILIFSAQNEDQHEISTDFFYSECVFSNGNAGAAYEAISQLKEIDLTKEKIDKIVSMLDGTDVFENKYIPKNLDDDGKVGGIIRRSLDITFKQDDTQRVISYQIPNGPQRIRGLAGTGKTVVLSLKAAFAHKSNKNFKILYVFNTQSLYGIVQKHITKYYMREAQETPDLDNKVDVLHAWGGASKNGLYKTLCDKTGLKALTFSDIRGQGEGLAVIYNHLLKMAGDRLEPTYDLVLIDEAQDFPSEFFETIYKITKNPKRIVWAYDEFQTLRDGTIKEPEELFGKDQNGNPNISNDDIKGYYPGEIEKDFVLSNCYRTPRPVLMTAHGVALALYSSGGAIQMFDQRSDWEAIGYKVCSPEGDSFQAGSKIDLERPDEHSKNLLEKIVTDMGENAQDLVQVIKCQEYHHQFLRVAEEAHNLIHNGGVRAEDILVVDLDTRKSSDDFVALRKKLSELGIQSVSPGFVEAADIFGKEGHVTLSTPFRAKGNESNIVFVLNSQKAISDATLRARNSFFIAVTRSRGWCYLVGSGLAMDALETEVNKIKSDYPHFIFTRPEDKRLQARKKLINKSDKELEALERISKDPDLLYEILSKDKGAMQRLIEKFNDEQ